MTSEEEQSDTEPNSEKSEHFKKKWNSNILHIRKDWYYKLVFISVLLQFHANNLKDSEIFNVEDINIYLKSSTYSNNIKFTKNYDNIKFIIKLNEYYDIKAFYKNNFLDNYINYNNL